MLDYTNNTKDMEQRLMRIHFDSKSKIKDSLKEKLLARMEEKLSLEELDLVTAAGAPWANRKEIK